MPSGATHDAITFLLAVPFGVAVYTFASDVPIAIAAAVAFVFGGVMFGPDLDTKSKQYSRWGPLRLLWFPYRTAFKHRSRWSHGLITGTLLRVVYFLGVASIMAFAAVSLAAMLSGDTAQHPYQFIQGWSSAGDVLSLRFLVAVFAGMWAGAASHTFADITITYIKTGRGSKLF